MLLQKNLKLFYFYVVAKTGPTFFKVEEGDIFVTNVFWSGFRTFYGNF